MFLIPKEVFGRIVGGTAGGGNDHHHHNHHLMLSSSASITADDAIDHVVMSSSSAAAANNPSNLRIIGGSDSSTVPYFIWLNGCAATLIHNDVALSAAHCSRRSVAKIGIRKRNESTDASSPSKTARVHKTTRHPNFDDTTYDYDFAVIKLGGWIEDAELVTLNGNDDVPSVGDGLTILGFGGSADTLQRGLVNYVNPLVCDYQWREYGYEINEQTIICAQNKEKGTDACNGKFEN